MREQVQAVWQAVVREQDMVNPIFANSAQTAGIVSPNPDDFGTIWSMTPSYDGHSTEIVPVIEGPAGSGKLELPKKKVAIIALDTPYSKGIAVGMVEAFESAGWRSPRTVSCPSARSTTGARSCRRCETTRRRC